jgi:hypothetical protein
VTPSNAVSRRCLHCHVQRGVLPLEQDHDGRALGVLVDELPEPGRVLPGLAVDLENDVARSDPRMDDGAAVLDEATSAVDEPSEQLLYRLIAKRLPATTVVSIAHRPTLARFHGTHFSLPAQRRRRHPPRGAAVHGLSGPRAQRPSMIRTTAV